MFDLLVFAITLTTLVVTRYLAETALVQYNRAHLTDTTDLLINNGLELLIFILLQGAFWSYCVISSNIESTEAAISFAVATVIFLVIKMITITAIRRVNQGE